jgi:hypothetical protein
VIAQHQHEVARGGLRGLVRDGAHAKAN